MGGDADLLEGGAGSVKGEALHIGVEPDVEQVGAAQPMPTAIELSACELSGDRQGNLAAHEVPGDRGGAGFCHVQQLGSSDGERG